MGGSAPREVLDFAPTTSPRNKVYVNAGYHDPSGTIAIMLKCPFDAMSLVLGKDGFPRGCIFILPSDGEMVLHGFLPKFINDPRQKTFDHSSIKGCLRVVAAIKVSGFLGLTGAFRALGVNYWFTTSKNCSVCLF